MEQGELFVKRRELLTQAELDELARELETNETRFLKGFCCAPCAPDLVKKLADIESRAWAEEEAALEASELVTP